MGPVVLRREPLASGYVKLTRLAIRIASGAEVEREVESHGDSIAVLPYDAVRRCALVVRLFRAPVFDATGAEILEEACAGMIDHGEPEDAVRREADEELGLKLHELEFVAKIWPSPGISTETAALYLAPYAPADRIGPGGGLASENEDITVVERSLAVLAAEADEGRIADGKLLTLVLALRLRHPDLFEASGPIDRPQTVPMIIVTGAMVARPETFEALLELCLAHVARSRREPGCISHAVHVDAEDPLRLVFFEEWADRAALDVHFRDADARAFVRDSRPLLAAGTPMKIYQAVAGG